jgi:three-Cys-motif partner protein
MSKPITGDDGLPADEVGEWAKEKHRCVCRYIEISKEVRKRWIKNDPRSAGATFIDPFCGSGRAKLRETGEWIDGGAVAAWRQSCADQTPFTAVYIGDLDPAKREACAKRLRQLGAPVTEMTGSAEQTIQKLVLQLNLHALHFAYLDPFDLATLNFSIIENLSRLKRIDMLIHFSQMDLQRNALANAKAESSAFDNFAPGWLDKVNLEQPQQKLREDIFEYWKNKVQAQNVKLSTQMRLIRGEKNQPLYLLLLAAKHDLANRFWQDAANLEGQKKLF